MYFVSINAGAQVAIILLACGPCVVIVNCLGHVLYLGRAPRIVGLSTGHPGFGASQFGIRAYVYKYLELSVNKLGIRLPRT